jgi:hypothetical protein
MKSYQDDTKRGSPFASIQVKLPSWKPIVTGVRPQLSDKSLQTKHFEAACARIWRNPNSAYSKCQAVHASRAFLIYRDRFEYGSWPSEGRY